MTQTFGELNVVVSQKERLVAFLLCFFLGVFGAHRFYAGRTLSAVNILVLNIIGWFTSFLGVGLVLIGIASFWVFIDFIIIIIGKFKDKNGYLILNWTNPAKQNG